MYHLPVSVHPRTGNPGPGQGDFWSCYSIYSIVLWSQGVGTVKLLHVACCMYSFIFRVLHLSGQVYSRFDARTYAWWRQDASSGEMTMKCNAPAT